MAQHIYMPNEVFDDLQIIESSTQRAFAYSYYYYINYLYRYCHWIDEDNEKVTQERIKEQLGYSATNKKINYIIKKDGILDTIGYTETTTNYPISYSFHEDFIEFDTVLDYKGELPPTNDRNFKIKKTTKSFYRHTLSQKQDFLDGTYYDVSNTHKVDVSVFKHIICQKDLQSVGFYIYGYLKSRTGIFRNGYQRSSKGIGKEIGFSDKTIRKYTDVLEDLGFISIERMDFKPDCSDEDREANIYRVR